MMRQFVGPAPVVGQSVLVLTAVAVLTASADVLMAVVRIWRHVRGVNAASFRVMLRRRQQSDAMARLDAMIGLGGEQAEIRSLIARLKVEAVRQGAGLAAVAATWKAA